MAQRLELLNVNDFRGGIQMRSDAFQLAENEVQLCLNVEIDARGGFVSRKGWQRWNPSTLTEPDWDPRSMHTQVFGTTEHVLVSNKAVYTGGGAAKGTVLDSTVGTFSPILVGANPLVCAAAPHMADFGQWAEKLYIACGSGEQAAKWLGTGAATLLTAAATATFTEIDAPSGAVFPKANMCETHGSYMFVAGTNENGTEYPNRIRWSHPGNPEQWRASDFYDFSSGGSKITGLATFGDYLLVFKTDSVWRVDGYDADSWSYSNVSTRLGCPHPQAVAIAEDRVYFLSYPHGVFELTADGGLYEASEQLRPGLQSVAFNGGALDNIWLNYVGQRLWCNVPFSVTGESTPTDAVTSAVLDRTLSEKGSWMAFRGADQGTFGPMVEATLTDRTMGALRATAAVAYTNAVAEPLDDLDGTDTAFNSYLTTRWFDGGTPTQKKTWRRPDMVVKDSVAEVTITFEVYTDFDESAARRRFDLVVDQRSNSFVWGDWEWGDGELWGGPTAGSRIERAPSLGLARNVRFRVTGPPGVRWGVDAFILKIVRKRTK